jgi:hypothetical protein
LHSHRLQVRAEKPLLARRPRRPSARVTVPNVLPVLGFLAADGATICHLISPFLMMKRTDAYHNISEFDTQAKSGSPGRMESRPRIPLCMERGRASFVLRIR